MKPRIYVTQTIPDKVFQLLAPIAHLEINPDAAHIPTKQELLEGVHRNDILFSRLNDVIDADVIRANPQLKLIASMAIVPSAIDVPEASARGIPVSTVPRLTTEVTAELNWALMLAVARNVVPADRAVRSGVFPGGQSMCFLGSGMAGKTLGILGMGLIGEAVARRAGGFEMKLLYYKRSRLAPGKEKELKVEFVPFEELLRRSDFLSVNIASTEATHHMIGARELRLMKPTAYLVNTARGRIIDEKALVEALRGGVIAGAGLDVYEHEPAVDPGLIGLDNVVLLPHLGSATLQTREAMGTVVAENIIAVIEGRRPPNICNPEIYS
ncbi:MAG: D-glycerate dehydrogenase [bacterium]